MSKPTHEGWFRFRDSHDSKWCVVYVEEFRNRNLYFCYFDMMHPFWEKSWEPVSDTTDDQWAGEIPMPEDGE